jgi:hypothetical protein
MSFTDRLQSAEDAYTLATEHLAIIAQQYQNGPGKAYAEALARRADLLAKIERHQSDKDNAEATFKQAFSEAGFTITKAVRSALDKKNDATAIIDELNTALTGAQADIDTLLIAASRSANSHRGAYLSACERFARVLVLRALHDHGVPIAQLLNSLPSDRQRGTDSTEINVLGDSRERALKEIMAELNLMAQEVGQVDGVEQPPFPDLGVLAVSDILSPVKLSMMKQISG